MTLVISSELLLLRHYRGLPSTGEIFAFAGGAIAGYVTLAAFARRSLAEIEPIDAHETVRIGVTHAFAVGTALTVGLGVSHLQSFAAWPLTAWVGVTTYVGLSAFQHLSFGVRR